MSILSGAAWRHTLRLTALLLLGVLLAGCVGASLNQETADPIPTFEPLSLVVTPTPPYSVAPLPTAEAGRVFQWPSNGKPSLVFVFDDSPT